MRETMVEGPDPLLGATIAGRYTVMRRIARGGMGVVYLAVQEGLGRAVALKIIRREAASDPVMQKRFEREARAVSALGHPAIVTVHDFGRTDDGSLFLAMEFVDGEVLRDALRRKKRFAFVETLPIIENIASALARAHAAGVVHRDLKPENVMLPRQSATTTGAVHAKVLDFGLAKPHDPDLQGGPDEHLTKEGGFVGTPGYASPEQAEGAPESPRQDLYALGVLWFELLSGEHPFAAPTPMKVVVRQLHEEPPSLPPMSAHGSLADVPPAAVALVRRLMSRRAEDRPDSAHVVLDEIARIRATLMTSVPSVTSTPPLAPGSVVRDASLDSQPDAPTLDGRAPSPLRASLDVAPPSAGVARGGVAAASVAGASVAGAGVAGAGVAAAGVAETRATPPPPARAGGFMRIAVGAIVAGAIGAVVVAAASGGLDGLLGTGAPGTDATNADAGVAHDALVDGDAHSDVVIPRTQLRGVEVIIEALPSFKALHGVRAALPPSQLRGYTSGTASFIVLDAEAAGPLADQLQGFALHSDLPLVLEVKELGATRLVLTAVRPEDASALADAGALLDGGAIADAGDVDVVAPGGLAP
jgi:serine/threonine protein kinase